MSRPQETKVEVSFEATSGDYEQVHKSFFYRYQGRNLTLPRLLMFSTLAPVCVFVLGVFQNGIPSLRIVRNTFVVVGAMGVFVALCIWLITKIVLWVMTRKKVNAVMKGERSKAFTASANDRAIKGLTKDSIVYLSWIEVESIENRKEGVICFVKDSALMVPSRAFPNDQQQEQFYEQIVKFSESFETKYNIVGIAIVDTGLIRDWDSFHDQFMEIFGFPDDYGRTMDSWVECLASLDRPEDGLTSLHIVTGSELLLDLIDADDLQTRCPEQYDAILSGVDRVNESRAKFGRPPIILT